MRKERRGEKGKRETEQLEYAYWRRVDLKRERERVCVCVWGGARRAGHEESECMRKRKAWSRESECVGSNERRYAAYPVYRYPRVEAAPCLITTE